MASCLGACQMSEAGLSSRQDAILPHSPQARWILAGCKFCASWRMGFWRACRCRLQLQPAVRPVVSFWDGDGKLKFGAGQVVNLPGQDSILDSILPQTDAKSVCPTQDHECPNSRTAN